MRCGVHRGGAGRLEQEEGSFAQGISWFADTVSQDSNVVVSADRFRSELFLIPYETKRALCNVNTELYKYIVDLVLPAQSARLLWPELSISGGAAAIRPHGCDGLGGC